MNLLVLVIDRLHPGYLGAYGNSWIETPAFDRLAAESFLFDQALSFTTDLDAFYRAVWQGLHPLAAQEATTAKKSSQEKSPSKKSAAGGGHCVKPLVDRLKASGIETRLLTDDPAMATLPAACGIFFEGWEDVAAQDKQREMELKNLLPQTTGQLAKSVDKTHLATCFARLISNLTTVKEPFGFWCHLASLGKIWDAPLHYRQRYAEEGDPDPSTSDQPVETILDADYDPDELLTTTWSYAANVAVLDECLGALLEYLDESGLADDTALILTSPRSYPLGEHRRVGPCDNAPYEESVHVPLLIRLPDRTGATARSNALVTPLDLFETLAELAEMNLGKEAAKNDDDYPDTTPQTSGESLLPIIREEKEKTARDRVLLGLPGSDRAIRTALWHMRLTDPPELYVKPDDRWEVNNVADRLPEETAALRAIAEEDLAPLPEILRHPPE